jgi:hypothetical protein
VLAQHVQGHPPALRSEPHAVARLMRNQSFVGHRFHHGGGGTGDDGERGGERTHWHQSIAALGKQQDVLQVIFNRAGGHDGAIRVSRFEATKDLF